MVHAKSGWNPIVQTESKYYDIYKVKIHEITLREIMILQAIYLCKTQNEIENIDFYLAYNFFRLAGILQGILGRVRDGTAASEHAEAQSDRVRPLAEAGWGYAKKAGAV